MIFGLDHKIYAKRKAILKIDEKIRFWLNLLRERKEELRHLEKLKSEKMGNDSNGFE